MAFRAPLTVNDVRQDAHDREVRRLREALRECRRAVWQARIGRLSAAEAFEEIERDVGVILGERER